MSSRALLLAILVALALPGSASALIYSNTYNVVAGYGEGATTCTITTSIYDRPFSDHWEWNASTSCSVAIQQFGEAWWEGEDNVGYPWSFYGGSCTAFATSCRVDGDAQGEYQGGDVRYHVRLRAPNGQGWLTTPGPCSGVGTDNLECWF